MEMKKTPKNTTVNEASNNYDKRRDKTHDILIRLKNKSGILWKQGGSPKLTGTTSDINEAHVDHPKYLYLHHIKMQAKWRQYIECTSMQGEL